MIFATTALAAALAVLQPAEPRARAPQTDQVVTVTRGARLSITNFAGHVNIRTWEKDALRVQAQHPARARVNIRTTPNVVAISSSGSAAPPPVDYIITVPAWMPVRVDGVYSSVSFEGAQGEIFAETVRGAIVVKGGAGSVTAKSVEGEVMVEGARGRITAHSVNDGVTITNTTGDISTETVNGGITLTGVQASNVEAATVNGHITYDGVALDGGKYRFSTHNGNVIVGIPEGSNATFTVRTHHGRFSPTLPVKAVGEAARGQRAVYTLGTGSAEVEMESFNGTIRLRRAERVRADSRE